LSPTPVSIYVFRKGKLINKADKNIETETTSNTQPQTVVQIGKDNLPEDRQSFMIEYSPMLIPMIQISGFNMGIFFNDTMSTICIIKAPAIPINILFI
jgi:hypothetical protein